MRSVAHDMGKLAGCGAHLQSLRRTAVAEFSLADAHSLEELERAAHNLKESEGASRRRAEDGGGNSDHGNSQKNDEGSDSLASLFVHPRKLLPSLPAVAATDEILARIRHGRPVNLPELSRAREVKVFSGQHDLIAICSRVAGTLFHPKIVLL
jgi:tRNA pseudouridine55 synthase